MYCVESLPLIVTRYEELVAGAKSEIVLEALPVLIPPVVEMLSQASPVNPPAAFTLWPIGIPFIEPPCRIAVTTVPRSAIVLPAFVQFVAIDVKLKAPIVAAGRFNTFSPISCQSVLSVPPEYTSTPFVVTIDAPVIGGLLVVLVGLLVKRIKRRA